MIGKCIVLFCAFLLLSSGCSDKKESAKPQSTVKIQDLITFFKSEGLKVEDAPASGRDKKFVEDTKKNITALNKAWGVKNSKHKIIHLEYRSVKINGIVVRIKRYASKKDAATKFKQLIAKQKKYPPRENRMTYYHQHSQFILVMRNYAVKLDDNNLMVPQKIELDKNSMKDIWKIFDRF